MNAALAGARRARRLRGRRGHRGRDLLHGRDLRATSAARCSSRSARATSAAPSCAEYEAALEDEAFPFEEKAIEVHEKNLELIGSGVYNAWIEKSLARARGARAGPLREARVEQRVRSRRSTATPTSAPRAADAARPRESPDDRPPVESRRRARRGPLPRAPAAAETGRRRGGERAGRRSAGARWRAMHARAAVESCCSHGARVAAALALPPLRDVAAPRRAAPGARRARLHDHRDACASSGEVRADFESARRAARAGAVRARDRAARRRSPRPRPS